MSRNITTNEVRSILNADQWDANQARVALIARCDALDEMPADYGFEWVADDERFGNEGSRAHYYLWRYPQEKLPEGFTSRVYIEGIDDEAPEDSEILWFRAWIIADDGAETDSEQDLDFARTMAEVVAWLNPFLGGEIIKREAGHA